VNHKTALTPSSAILVADPKRNYLAHKLEIDSAIQGVLGGGTYILGPEVEAFEREFAQYLGIRQAIGVGSGTEALHLALRTCGIGPKDLVITVSHTAVATVAAIELTGATPVFVDTDADTFTMDARRLKEALDTYGQRVKAVIPVHLYGHPADMPRIMEVASKSGIFVIEDCAQSHGATLDGRMTGTWGHMAAFSFYPTKNLGALGDAGALVTSDGSLAEKARLLRQYGWRTRYISDVAGLNTRLDEVQAAILRVKLRYLDRENAKRQAVASIYNSALASTNLLLPKAGSRVHHVYHQYTVRSDRRDQLRKQLEIAGIGTAILYPQPVHLQPAYLNRLEPAPGGLEQTERASREILSLPMHPYLSDKEIERITEAVVTAES
jgi:dTDP-4-amino-4,6-dideoxygalactose transaminase